MDRVRIAGPRGELDHVLAVLQDAGLLHLDRPHTLGPSRADPLVVRERRHLERCLRDVEATLDLLRASASAPGSVKELRRGKPASTRVMAGELVGDNVRRARRLRREAGRLRLAHSALEDERALLARYREFFQAFEALAGRDLTWPDGQAFYVILRAGAEHALDELRRSLETAVGGDVELLSHELSSGEWAVLILASPGAAPKVSALLAASRVEELPPPPGLVEANLLRAMPAIKARLAAIPSEMAAVEAERLRLLADAGEWLVGLRAWLRDRLLVLDARGRVHAARHLFVIEGWLPSGRTGDLEAALHRRFGPDVVLTPLGPARLGADATPVALRNPPVFRPFEVFTRPLPLPRYGTIDPTPFVAVFFPAFFGLMMGDVGHGVLLAILAGVLRLKSRPDTTLRSISMVGLACSSSTIVFGLLFGELFGSLGHAIGLAPVFNREEAMIGFLGLTIAIGAVHLLLGLVLAVLGAWRRGERRHAMGRGVAFAMLVLTSLALLAALEVLPSAWFTPFVVAVLVAFPLLVALEGVVAVIELVSTFGHVLSYARIMALGIASLMLAVVANQMVGAMGSVVVGVVFALLFHVVNFAIGVFSPTIHALRLHYVEFFGEFFSPGGTEYRPLGHWNAPRPQDLGDVAWRSH
jgi:V/A-type H+-transporting ATPase subunit I